MRCCGCLWDASVFIVVLDLFDVDVVLDDDDDGDDVDDHDHDHNVRRLGRSNVMCC
jgi:hypothetical protein